MLASHAKVHANTFGMAPWSQNETRMSNHTPKQLRFVEEYLRDLNATQAAIRAGYSPKTAKVQGCQMLKLLGHHLNPDLNLSAAGA